MVGSSGVSSETSLTGRSRAASTARIADASNSAWRNSRVARVAVAHDGEPVGEDGVVDDD